jgi:hypothetical protein
MSVQTYFEADLSVSMPVLPLHAWDNAEQELEQVLAVQEAPALEGDRFLTGRMMHHVQLEGRQALSAVYYEYMLQRNGSSWKREIAVWKKNTPCNYDFDVFEVRPMEESLGYQ